MKLQKRFLFSLILLLSAVLISCGDDDTVKPSGINVTEGDDVFEVTFSDNTVYFDENSTDILVREYPDDSVYVFDESDSRAAGLKVGDIIFVHGKIMGRITETLSESGEMIVRITKATLNELIADGNIGWNKPIEFTDAIIPSIVQKGGDKAMKPVGVNKFEQEFELSGFKGKITVDMLKDSAKVVCELSKEAGTAKGSLKFEGFVYKFNSKADMRYSNSELKKFDFLNDGCAGELTLTMIATGNMTPDIVQELPFVLFKIPFLVGGIPMELNITTRFVIKMQMNSLDASSWVSAKFKYNSSAGFTFDGVNTGIGGSIGNYTMDKEKAQTGASMAISANFGINFPRLELSIFGNTVVPYVMTSFMVNGFYRPGIHPCQEAKALYQASCGVDFSFLGFFKATKNHTLWEKEEVLLKAGDCD